MEKIKKIYNFINFLFSIIPVIIHELSHIIMLIITLQIFSKIEIEFINKSKFYYKVSICRNIARNKFLEYMVSLAPLFSTIAMIIFSFYNLYFGIIFIPYFLLYYRQFLPSLIDYDAIKNWMSLDDLLMKELKEDYNNLCENENEN